MSLSPAQLGMRMTAQLEMELPAKEKPSAAPKVTQLDLEWMIDQLRGKGWVKSAVLGAHTEKAKRRLRAIAEISGGAIVSYPGSPGYKLLDSCTLDDLRHGDRAMRSQLKAMARRWKPIWKRMHKLQLVERAAS
jgi:hypothetical protein